VTGSKIPLNPLFHPMNLIERHRAGAFRKIHISGSLSEPVHETRPSLKVVHPMSLSNPCWTGQCQTCGKWLISATWDLLRATDNVTCYRDPQRCA